jgi:hypothetical protein
VEEENDVGLGVDWEWRDEEENQVRREGDVMRDEEEHSCSFAPLSTTLVLVFFPLSSLSFSLSCGSG